jgi:hypothetical protein
LLYFVQKVVGVRFRAPLQWETFCLKLQQLRRQQRPPLLSKQSQMLQGLL